MNVSQVFRNSVRDIAPELSRRGLGCVCAEPADGWLLPYDGRRLESSFYRTYWAALELLQQGLLTIEGTTVPVAPRGCRFLLRVAGRCDTPAVLRLMRQRDEYRAALHALLPASADKPRLMEAWGICPITEAPIRFGMSADGGFVFEVTHELALARRDGTTEQPAMPTSVPPRPESTPADAVASTAWQWPEQDRLLIVEDDALSAKITRLMVEALGFGGVAVNDGADAVEACRRFAPVAVIMDQEMPRMNGTEATAQIRRLQRTGDVPPCKIIMLTGSSDPTTRTAAFEAGVDAFLEKPARLDEIREQLRLCGIEPATGRHRSPATSGAD
ncbi:response regulator [Piscinibacter sp. XHJ-5]|uniref:response regulator n=1 Tax=Piscinibacter sp. XHJ-5 TaxID=3037797 RepID=UPI0024528507|nr:response regulator [Piscinibacter sp. XHJ-5]